MLDDAINEKVLEALHAGELKTKLMATNYNIHKKCYNNYTSTKLNQKIAANNKKTATALTCNTRNSHEPVKRFALECMYCEKPDTDSAKHPNKANQLHANAAHKTDAKYVNEFTEIIRAIAAQLGDTKSLNKVTNDVKSKELYYRNSCHAEYKRKYNNKTFNKVENSDITYDEFSVLTSIKNYINDSEYDSFDLKSLEKLYIDGLAEIGKSIDSHITQFAAKIVNADIGLTIVQSASGGKYKAFNTSRLAAVIPDVEWCQMLRKVVEPIREEEVHKMEKSSMSDLSLEPLSLQYKIINELLETVKALYNDSGGKVLPSALHGRIFTIFVDDNVEKNRSSVTVAGHFHGTGVTVLQFPSEENPDTQCKRKTFKELQSVLPQS